LAQHWGKWRFGVAAAAAGGDFAPLSPYIGVREPVSREDGKAGLAPERRTGMRIQVRDPADEEELLQRLVEAARSVVEGHLPPALAADLRMGLYVALRQVLAERLVLRPDCGKFAVCADLPEKRPFPPTEKYSPRRS
jgi:hypothetical protein